MGNAIRPTWANKRSPGFLSHLAVNGKVAASTQNQAFSALLFLYQQVLERKLDHIAGVERVRRPPKLPVVFTRPEARAVLAHLKGDFRLMAHLLYGSGLRLLECLRLRVKGYRFRLPPDHSAGRQRNAATRHLIARASDLSSRPI